jgi:putative ABC transport system permease protein
VAHAEAWAETAATVVAPPGDGTRTPPGVTVLGPERGTRLLSPALLAGRWLRPEDDAAGGGAAVVNQALAKRWPALHVGGTLALRANDRTDRTDRTVTLPIVGIVEELVPTLTVYAPPAAVSALIAAVPNPRGVASVRSLRIVTAGRDAAAQRAAGRAVEQALVGAGIAVAEVRRMDDLRQALKDHFVIVVSALVLAASLVIVVGGLGLTSALTLDVLERTREIGILGALGATPRAIAGQVVVEGVVLGLLSGGVAVLAAFPITLLLDVVAGRIFVGSPFLFTFSPRAALLWLAVVVALAAASSFPPAWRAARRTVAEALTYA